eukprot:XP_001701808.1 response regulator of potential two component system [Chlamydomonas reinhardtii]
MEANGFHVVLVEDDNICLKVVEQLLRKLSYRVSTASDGAAALKVLADCKQRGDKVDLILTDILMPEVTGFDLINEVVHGETFADIPVVASGTFLGFGRRTVRTVAWSRCQVMSSQDSQESVLQAFQAGAADYLIKPIRKNELATLWQHVWRANRAKGGQTSSGAAHGSSANGPANHGAAGTGLQSAGMAGSTAAGAAAPAVLAGAGAAAANGGANAAAHTAGATGRESGQAAGAATGGIAAAGTVIGWSHADMDVDGGEAGAQDEDDEDEDDGVEAPAGTQNRKRAADDSGCDGAAANNNGNTAAKAGAAAIAAGGPGSSGRAKATDGARAEIRHNGPPSARPSASLADTGGDGPAAATAPETRADGPSGPATTQGPKRDAVAAATAGGGKPSDAATYAAAAAAGLVPYPGFAPARPGPFPPPPGSGGPGAPPVYIPESVLQLIAHLSGRAAAEIPAVPAESVTAAPVVVQKSGGPASAARLAAVAKYLEKRKHRNFQKKVRYESRKRLAEARPRVRGQFVKAGTAGAATASGAAGKPELQGPDTAEEAAAATLLSAAAAMAAAAAGTSGPSGSGSGAMDVDGADPEADADVMDEDDGEDDGSDESAGEP